MSDVRTICIAVAITAFLPLTSPAAENDFSQLAKPFLQNYCMDCHDSSTQEGDVSFHDLDAVSANNAELWKRIWEQVALKEMPPRDEGNQPELRERLEISNWITEQLTIALKSKGGFTAHMHPGKGNHLDHDLLFGTHTGLEPTSTPARIWRIHPQEHLVRLNELISREKDYDPERPGSRTRGDHIPVNLPGEIKVYFGLDRYLGHLGGSAAYASSVSGFSAALTTVRDHGLRNYPFLYTVNGSEATQIVSVAEQILRFMAYGPNAGPFQFADKMSDIPEEYKDFEGRGSPASIYYTNEIKRPLTPVYQLMTQEGVSDEPGEAEAC